MPTNLANAKFMSYMNGHDDFRDWQRKQEQRIRDEKTNDPKTVFGWTLKGMIE
jgi:hypothetical protein